jgi:hypothetical protein
MKLNEMFPSKYANGTDLQGKPVTVTIQTVRPEQMRPNQAAEEVTKFVVYFVEAKRGVVLNKTLAQQIAKITGSDDTDNWEGKRITLYPEPVTVAGVARVAIRARAAAPQAAGNGNGKESQ